MRLWNKPPGLRSSVDNSAKVRKLKALVHSRPDCIRHVRYFFCSRLLTKFHEKLIKITRDADGHMQDLSDVRLSEEAFGTSYDYLFYAVNCIHSQAPERG